MNRSIIGGAAVLAAMAACQQHDAKEDRAMAATVADKPKLVVTSASFAHGTLMPAALTCEGKDVSPALAWTGAPAGTKSFAVIIDDPDAPDPKAPKTVWVHWVVYDLPADRTTIAESAAAGGLPPGARDGKHDWGQAGYRGPCPPTGRHRYFHKVYALDTTLGDLGTPKKAALERAMTGHVLAYGEIVGLYEKGQGR